MVYSAALQPWPMAFAKIRPLRRLLQRKLPKSRPMPCAEAVGSAPPTYCIGTPRLWQRRKGKKKQRRSANLTNNLGPWFCRLMLAVFSPLVFLNPIVNGKAPAAPHTLLGLRVLQSCLSLSTAVRQSALARSSLVVSASVLSLLFLEAALPCRRALVPGWWATQRRGVEAMECGSPPSSCGIVAGPSG